MRTKALPVLLILLAMSAVAVKPWWSKKAEVIAVHHAQYRTDILVSHFPWTDRKKIAWWLAHAEDLSARYHFQLPGKSNDQHISIWQFGAGYMAEGKEDRMCFDDMPGPDNCIDKQRIMSIKSGAEGESIFLMPDDIYTLAQDGEVHRVSSR